MLEFGEEEARAVERSYMTEDVVRQRERLVELLDPGSEDSVLDIGFGPGYLAVELAERTGAVHAVDPSEAMLAIAERRDGAERVTWSIGDALALGVEDASFDAAVSTQVYEYVPDMPAALAEARRALKPGGRLLIMDTDWDSLVWRTSDAERMAHTMRVWDEHLAHPDLPRQLPALLRAADLALEHCEVIPLLNVGYDPDTYSGGLIKFVERFVATRGLDAGDWAAELRDQGEDYFFSINRYAFIARR
jgi:SAM-dependent methyltransferase